MEAGLPIVERRQPLRGRRRRVDDVVGDPAEGINGPDGPALFGRQEERREIERLGMLFSDVAAEQIARLDVGQSLDDGERVGQLFDVQATALRP
jgi:hypothetical protein